MKTRNFVALVVLIIVWSLAQPASAQTPTVPVPKPAIYKGPILDPCPVVEMQTPQSIKFAQTLGDVRTTDIVVGFERNPERVLIRLQHGITIIAPPETRGTPESMVGTMGIFDLRPFVADRGVYTLVKIGG